MSHFIKVNILDLLCCSSLAEMPAILARELEINYSGLVLIHASRNLIYQNTFGNMICNHGKQPLLCCGIKWHTKSTFIMKEKNITLVLVKHNQSELSQDEVSGLRNLATLINQIVSEHPAKLTADLLAQQSQQHLTENLRQLHDGYENIRSRIDETVDKYISTCEINGAGNNVVSIDQYLHEKQLQQFVVIRKKLASQFELFQQLIGENHGLS